MEYLEFLLYGLIQGLTEFIPISSTAHLKIISLLLGINDPGPSLSAIIQLGSVFAIFYYFRNDFYKFKNKFSKSFFDSFLYKRILISILIGTIPIAFFGGIIKLCFSNFFENILRSNFTIGIISLIMAFFMYLADISQTSLINIRNHKYFDSLLIGFAQAFAIIPGVSRSGITISTALLSGWERKDAAKYSFLLGIPAISISAMVEFIFSINNFNAVDIISLTIGLISTFFSSLFAIDFLIKYLSSKGLKLFIYYRIIFGIVILLNL